MDLAVGVDPGVNTGLSTFGGGALQVIRSGFAVDIEYAVLALNEAHRIVVYIEDARLRTWFPKVKRKGKWVDVGSEVLQGVGSVKRDSQRWEEFCINHDIKYKLVHPKHVRTKMPAEQFKRITGWTARTNEHGRDAAMIVFGRQLNSIADKLGSS